MTKDPFDLNRFVIAQSQVIDKVRAELAQGRKRSHWMWFIFPQMAGLGSSIMSRRYAIGSLAEANSYLAHPILGERLRECVELVLQIEGRTAYEIFGSPDDMKYRSSLTLFADASGELVFLRSLDEYFDGKADEETLRLLSLAEG